MSDNSWAVKLVRNEDELKTHMDQVVKRDGYYRPQNFYPGNIQYPALVQLATADDTDHATYLTFAVVDMEDIGPLVKHLLENDRDKLKEITNESV